MKKILLASVGVFAMSAFAAQAAEPVKLSISGFMDQYVGYADNDYKGYAKFDQQSEAEIDFSGETTLDNGLNVGVSVTMIASQNEASYAEGANKNVKYAYAWIAGKYGKISLGQQDSVSSEFHNSSPNFGIGGQDGKWMEWIDPAGNGEGVNATYVWDDKASDKINLYTPQWNGFQAGFTYVPDTNPANTGSTAIARKYQTHGDRYSMSDMYLFGIAYENEFENGVGVSADIGYTTGNVNVDGGEYKLEAYQGGLNVSYMGFTVGGSYLKRDSDGYVGKAMAMAGDFWDLGAAYEDGPWGVSLSYYRGQARSDETSSSKDKSQALTLSGKYDLGPGVQLTGNVLFVDYDGRANEERRNSGWAVVTGVNVQF